MLIKIVNYIVFTSWEYGLALEEECPAVRFLLTRYMRELKSHLKDKVEVVQVNELQHFCAAQRRVVLRMSKEGQSR